MLNIQGFILSEEAKSPRATGELSSILTEIAFGAKIVSREVNKAGLVDILGLTGKVNVQGEEVQKLDDYANDIFIQIFKRGQHIAGLASEEMEKIQDFSKSALRAKYVVCIDPLDGSSNVDANVSIGTIFSVYKRTSKSGNLTNQDFLQKGKQQVCAGYILYGSSTMMVYTTGKGVNGFTLDPSIGEFILSHENIKTPLKGKVYSVNEGYSFKWNSGVFNYIKSLKKGYQGYEKPHKARYIGSLVSDFHRNLLYGGVFLYPADKKNPNGKLRLLFEGNPMAMIIEQAGGRASNGQKEVLDIKPGEIHQRIPLFIGSKNDVKILLYFLKKEKR
ncbi:class 1 fructose-bisphosphatase [Patescibacteria group bacterium]